MCDGRIARRTGGRETAPSFAAGGCSWALRGEEAIGMMPSGEAVQSGPPETTRTGGLGRRVVEVPAWRGSTVGGERRRVEPLGARNPLAPGPYGPLNRARGRWAAQVVTPQKRAEQARASPQCRQCRRVLIAKRHHRRCGRG